MASNKRQLQQDKKHLTKAKAPSKPKDVLYTEKGQWEFPGKVTKVPTPTGSITMAGVNTPLYGVDNTGFAQMMYPENEYQFPGDVVTEYPQEAKRGGTAYKLTKPSKKGINSKAYSRSLMATNRLFLENPLFKKPKSKRNKIFDPKAKYYEDGGEQDDYVYIDNLSPDEIEEYAQGGYVVEDVSIPTLNHFQDGGEETDPPADGIAQRVQYAEGQTPEGFAQGMPVYSEVTKKAEAPYWLEASREYESKNSKQAFIDKKKRDYLKNTNKGLSKAAGLSMDNFPEDVERNFANEYDYKKNTYVAKKLGKEYGFSPKRRGEWVDYLSKGERNVIANSKFESKLQPSLWDRTLAGLVTLTTPFDARANDAMNRGELPGLTKKEQKEIKDAELFGVPVGGLEALAGLDALGVAAANALEQSGNSGYGAGYRESPSALSAQPMANVKPEQIAALNPLNYTLPYDIPLAGASFLRGVGNLGKFVKNAPRAINEKLIENAGRFAKPKFGELPINLAPDEISRLNQIDEARGIASYRNPNKPTQIKKFIQNTKLSDDDIIKIFGKTKEELLNVEEASKKASNLDNQLPPPPETIIIDQPASNFDGPAYLRRNPGLAEQLRNPAGRGADTRLYNLLMETAVSRNKNPLEELIELPQNIGSMFHSHKQVADVEAVPGLYGSSFQNKREMLEALNKQIGKGFENANVGDVITGSTNTSYNSYLPQMDYVFKNAGKEGLSKPIYLGYRPMNASGHLSEHGESLENILQYINHNLNKIQKRSGANLDLGGREPYIKNNVIFLPQYGLRKTGENVSKIVKEEGGEIIVDDLTDDQLREYVDGGYIIEKIH
jgi:hypothetical protein